MPIEYKFTCNHCEATATKVNDWVLPKGWRSVQVASESFGILCEHCGREYDEVMSKQQAERKWFLRL